MFHTDTQDPGITVKQRMNQDESSLCLLNDQTISEGVLSPYGYRVLNRLILIVLKMI